MDDFSLLLTISELYRVDDILTRIHLRRWGSPTFLLLLSVTDLRFDKMVPVIYLPSIIVDTTSLLERRVLKR